MPEKVGSVVQAEMTAEDWSEELIQDETIENQYNG